MISFVLLLALSNPIVDGDRLFLRQQYADAAEAYIAGRPLSLLDAESAWRAARAYICLGDSAPEDEREASYRKALEATSAAVLRDSLNSRLQCWYAVSLGYIALFEGSRTKVEYSRRIQRSLERAIALDPANDIAYSVLGTFYRMLAKVSWFERQLAELILGGLPAGGVPEAERMLRRAVHLAPQIIRHRYELGLVYREMGNREEMRQQFVEALRLPPVLVSDAERIAEMKRIMSSSK